MKNVVIMGDCKGIEEYIGEAIKTIRDDALYNNYFLCWEIEEEDSNAEKLKEQLIKAITDHGIESNWFAVYVLHKF